MGGYRIMACIPVRGMVSADFLVNIINRMDEYAVEFRQKILFSPIVPLDAARNQLVKKSLQEGVDYIWFIDTDSIIGRGTIPKLFECGSTVSSGIYFKKQPPYDPVMYKKVGDDYKPIREFQYSKILPVDAVGMGCALIDTKIFDYIKKPYFKFEYDEDGKMKSEDIYFCEKVKDAGFEVKVNTGAVIGHWGGLVTHVDFENFKINNPDKQ